MFPQVTNRRMDEMGNGPKDPNVGALTVTNRDEIIEKFRKNQIKVDSDKIERTGGQQASGEKPPNWMHMKEDGTITNGYKLTEQLTKWFESGGKEIIEEINKLTVTKKLEKPIA